MRKPNFFKKRSFALFCGLALFFSLPCAASDAPAFEAAWRDDCGIRVAVSTFALPNPNWAIVDPTLRVLAESLRPRSVCFRQIPLEALEQEVRAGEIDLFLSSSGFYRRVADQGVRDIASVAGPHVTNPNEAEGSVFIALADRDDLGDIASMRGMRAAANRELSFTGRLAASREILRAGYDPEKFFSETRFFGSDLRPILDALLRGEVDVGMMRACTCEELLRMPRYAGRFKAVALKEHEGFGCLHSTELYPSWVIGATRRMPPYLTAQAARDVLAMPATPSGLFWLMATDFSEVDALYRELRIGPYEFLRHWTWSRFWEEYGRWVIFALILVAGLAVHSWRSDRLVERRTRELRAAWDEEKRLEAQAEELRDRMSALRRAGVIGQVSSMIAHELSQPLASARLYAHGLRRRIEGRMVSEEDAEKTLLKIEKQAERAGAIVDRVRAYARSRGVKRVPVDLKELLAGTAARFRITSRGAKLTVREIDESGPGPLWIEADPLEVELVFANLLRNSADALQHRCGAEARVLLSTPAPERALVAVIDNGGPIPDDVFERLSAPLTSAKAEGLGLGLSICRSIVESHFGSMSFSRPRGGGLCVEVSLPLMEAGNQETLS